MPRRGQGEQAQSQHAVETTTEVAAQKAVEARNEAQKVVKGGYPEEPEAPAARQRFPLCERDEEDRDLQGRKQEIRGYRKERNLRLVHSTERSRLRVQRRIQKTTSAQRRSESHRGEVRWRGKTQELKSVELKNKVQTVEKSLEEQQHRNNRRYSKQLNSSRPEKKPGRLQRRTP